jgi:hypothetical protein
MVSPSELELGRGFFVPVHFRKSLTINDLGRPGPVKSLTINNLCNYCTISLESIHILPSHSTLSDTSVKLPDSTFFVRVDLLT